MNTIQLLPECWIHCSSYCNSTDACCVFRINKIINRDSKLERIRKICSHHHYSIDTLSEHGHLNVIQ